MKKPSILLLISCICFGMQVQSASVPVLNQVLQHFNRLKSIGYTVSFIQKNPFSAGEVTTGKYATQLCFDTAGQIAYKWEEKTLNQGQIQLNDAFYQQKNYSFNLIDSTFTVEPGKETASSLTDFMKRVRDTWLKKPSKLLQLKDTLFNGLKCYAFLYKAYDTTQNGQHDYTHVKFLIDQKNLLPVYVKDQGEGNASKGGFSLGRLQFFEENFFSDYRLNQESIQAIHIPEGFTAPHTALLGNGVKAPALRVKDLKGDVLTVDDLRGKIRLIVFGATSCPANPLANPMLNRLHLKYLDQGISVMNIYNGESIDQAERYRANNQLVFPIYISDRKFSKSYQVLGSPDFYLVDQHGKIVFSLHGYREDLESELTRQIDTLLKE